MKNAAIEDVQWPIQRRTLQRTFPFENFCGKGVFKEVREEKHNNSPPEVK